MALNAELDLNLHGKLVSKKIYQGTIGSLLYLIASRTNIGFIICLCVRFQNTPKELHLTAVKKILDILQVPKALVYGISKIEISISLVFSTP